MHTKTRACGLIHWNLSKKSEALALQWNYEGGDGRRTTRKGGNTMEDGTIVHVDYELYNNETGDLIETTREAVAKEHDAHQENRSYEPMVCIVGGGQLLSLIHI